MPSIHVKDEFAARYVKATGDTADFKGFVNRIVEEGVKGEEEKAEMLKGEGIELRQKRGKEREK